jgi:phosphate acetyltransferase
MLKNLYIAALETGSGKSLVLLGIMEMLSKRIHRLGFFRPVIHGGTQRDNDIELIRSRYHLDVPYEAQYALTHEEAQHLVADGQYDELLKRVIAKYKALERQCDFVVCEGCDSTEIDPVFMDNFNTRVANHLAAPILLVASGQGKTPEEVVRSVRTEREAFLEAGCPIAATVVNRVDPTQYQQTIAQLEPAWADDDPVFVLPEEELLAKPTIAEIAKALNAKLLHGRSEQLNREVLSVKAAAMQLPNFLDRMREGSLILTPGDRPDVVLGCLAATFSDNYPTIAGVVLTGGIKLAPSVQRLLDGVARWTVPIFSVETDTYDTAMCVNSVRAEITPDNNLKIASALGVFESHIDVSKLEARLAVAKSDRITPIMFEFDLIERARVAKQHIVLPEGSDERILRASEILLRRGVVDITLLGNESKIREQIATLGLNLEEVNIIDQWRSPWHDDYAATYFELRQHKGITEDCARDVMHDANYFGTMMVYKGVADGMVSGALHTTAHTIRPALEFIRTQPGCSIVSSVFLMCLDDRVLVYGDCAVNPNPNPQQLADIAISSAMTAQMFGIEPLVALLSYSTGESGKGEDVEKVKEATRLAKQQRPDLKIEGPIQYDAAVDESVARTKLPNSEVAGHATVFVFPDLNTGNNTYKAVQRSANAVAIGPVLQGLKKPVNDLSRGCTITDIVNTVAITAIQAQALKAATKPQLELVLVG